MPAGDAFLLSPVGNKTSYPRIKWVEEEGSSEQVKVMIFGEVHLCFLRYPFLNDSSVLCDVLYSVPHFLIVISRITGETPAVGYFFVGKNDWHATAYFNLTSLILLL